MIILNQSDGFIQNKEYMCNNTIIYAWEQSDVRHRQTKLAKCKTNYMLIYHGDGKWLSEVWNWDILTQI